MKTMHAYKFRFSTLKQFPFVGEGRQLSWGREIDDMSKGESSKREREREM